jgi:hypothetical protein
MGRQECIELTAGGPDDPDGFRTATILTAYFHAEHMRAFRRLLWRWLAYAACLWSAVTLTTSLFSRAATVGGFVIIGTCVCWPAILEWNAANRVGALVANLRATERSTGD